MDIAKIRKLIKLVQASDITEIEVVEGERSVRISRGGAFVAHAHHHPTMAVAQPVMAPTASPAMAAPVEQPAAAGTTEDTVNEEHIFKSPMVGTFYTASSPDAEPFVRPGSSVKKGDTLCIIEAMKLMNQIEAEYDGVIRAVLLDNATPVQYGQAIFEITPV